MTRPPVGIRLPLALFLVLGSLPACECAGTAPPDMIDAGDGALPDGGGRPDTGPGPDAGDVGPESDTGPRPDAGPCTPSGDETCNDLDDDCDGMVDEGVVRVCGSDVGECIAGVEICSGGVFTACSGEVGPAPSESCNGLDDDCNGTIDEGCSCTDGATQSCGSDVGACMPGVQTCAGGSWGACVGEVTAAPETCNGVDDNCDGTTDEGCSCVDGATQPCGTDVGVCVAGTQTCSGGRWGACAGEVTGTTELCNGMDDDCDGMDDEVFPVGAACDGMDGDLCVEGMIVCDMTTGGTTCSDATGTTAELCNGMDDDCNGMADETFMLGAACDGADADLCNEGVIACDAAGGASCSDASGDSVEVCNGMDDDCDGNVDEGNPGGGVICPGAMDVGGCVSRTACVAGAIVCRGTFVAPTGLPTNPGTPAAPLSSIAAAIANAGILGGGADVCVCDTSAAGASTFTEDVTMVEGTSVLGGYDCTSWTITAGRVTAIQDVDDDGVTFPAGITSATALDRMTVDGLDRVGAATTTSAITVTDSSPTLSNDTVRAGDAATAIGLRVVESAGATASPTVTSGTYSSIGVAGGTAVAVSLEASSPRFSMVTIGGGGSGIMGGVATTAYGVRCVDCGGTTFSAGSVSTSGATTAGYGFHGTGALDRLSAMTTNFGGGSTSAAMSSSVGIRLEGCTGAPTFTSVTANGGFDGGATATATTRTAFLSSGASCAPVVDAGRYVGCERGNTCVGLECNTSSACVVRNAATLQGTVGSTDTAAFGARCLTSGCASLTGSTILPGNLRGAAITGSGLELDGASPPVDDCFVAGPGGTTTAGPAGRYDAVYLRATSSTISNSILRDVNVAGAGGTPPTFPGVITVVRYDQTAAGPALVAPTIVNDTIEYTPCTTCGVRVGLLINGTPGAISSPAGIVRNNIIRNLGAGGTTNPVIERNTSSDLQFFENNALFDPTATMGGALYYDEGATALTTAAQINTMMMGGTSGGNLVGSCNLTAAWRLPAASICRNAGTAMSCPRTDFDAQARPNEMVCDIGADEFYP